MELFKNIPRVIPCLLLKDGGLVKTVKFKKYNYIGDAVNAVKIFNEKGADELILLDIMATRNKKNVDFDFLKEIVSEAFMPVCYGGGIKDIETIKKVLYSGVEKISINTSSFLDPDLIKQASNIFGAQAIVVSIDINTNWFGKKSVYINGGNQNTNIDPIKYAKQMEDLGAGELLVNSIYKDGTMSGYDIDTINDISNVVNIPLIALGGAGNVEDMKLIFNKTNASAVAAGSMFVYTGIHKAVLINYSNNLS